MNQYRTVFVIVVVLIALAGFGLILKGNQQPTVFANQNSKAPKITLNYKYQNQTLNLELTKVDFNPLEGARFVMGTENAPFTVVEFSDYECPACGLFATEYESSFVAKFVSSGKVRFAYRDFPLPQHSNANIASLTAACAFDQGKFADFKAILFRAQNDWSQSTQARAIAQFGDYASQLGLDSLKLETCVQAKTAQAGIDSDLEMGKRVGLTATPSFVVNGYLVAGVLPPEAFEVIFKKLEEQRQ